MIRSADKCSAHSASRNVRKSFPAKLTEEIARQMVVRLLKRSSSSFSNVPNFTRWVDIHYSGQNASLMFSFRYMILKKILTNNHCWCNDVGPSILSCHNLSNHQNLNLCPQFCGFNDLPTHTYRYTGKTKTNTFVETCTKHKTWINGFSWVWAKSFDLDAHISLPVWFLFLECGFIKLD